MNRDAEFEELALHEVAKRIGATTAWVSEQFEDQDTKLPILRLATDGRVRTVVSPDMLPQWQKAWAEHQAAPPRNLALEVIQEVRSQVQPQPVRPTQRDLEKWAMGRAHSDAYKASRISVREEWIYHPAAQHSYVRDLLDYHSMRDPDAKARLERNKHRVSPDAARRRRQAGDRHRRRVHTPNVLRR
jgi:hypothetical protein